MSDYSSFMYRREICEEQIADVSISINTRFKRLVTAFKRHVRNRNQRRIDNKAFQHMLLLDETMLKDIGVTRGDIIWAHKLPLAQNASLELGKQAMVNGSRMHI